YTYSSAQAAVSLGRDLSACRGAANCTQRGSVELLPAPANQGSGGARFDERLTEVDTRLTRRFRLGEGRFEIFAELYNVFNARPPQAVSTTYGSTWLLPSAVLGGRLFKFGTQIDF